MTECQSDEGPKCPYCGHVHCETEDWHNVCSYWGSDDSAEYECSSCELTFRVVEHVTRWWESTPVVQAKAEEN